MLPTMVAIRAYARNLSVITISCERSYLSDALGWASERRVPRGGQRDQLSRA